VITVYDHARQVRHVRVGSDKDGYPVLQCGQGIRYLRLGWSNWCSHDDDDEDSVVGEWCAGRLRHRTLPECPACHPDQPPVAAVGAAP
jgi:hypothetical protein